MIGRPTTPILLYCTVQRLQPRELESIRHNISMQIVYYNYNIYRVLLIDAIIFGQSGLYVVDRLTSGLSIRVI